LEKEPSVQTAARNEIIEAGIKPVCEPAFLSAVIRGCGAVLLTTSGFGLTITNENRGLALLCQNIIKRRYGAQTLVEQIAKNIGMRELAEYRLSLANADKLLNECGIIKGYDFIRGIPKTIISRSSEKKAYLKGVFLSCGSLSTPKDKLTGGGTGYHLEFALNSELVVDDFMELLTEVCDFQEGVARRRKKQPSVYIKSSQNISDCLAAMGASKGVIQLQEVMATRAMRNHLNRGNNFILANIDKSVSAAQQQLNAIKKIEKHIGLQNIDEKLAETAVYRKDHPDASLAELAALMQEGTKSRINHRMRKLIEIAKNL
jgi:DNA-binding protein WhiA